MIKAVLYVAILLLVGVFSFSAGEVSNRGVVEENAERLAITDEVVPVTEPREEDFTDVVARALPTVVGIEARGRVTSDGSMGSGVIMSELGYIVTNQHVVGDNPSLIAVTLYDGSIREGRLCWSDKTLDVAVVKIEGNIPAVALMGEYESVRVGEDVFAIGNPLSLQFERSVTKGIVSAVNRTITINSGDTVVYMEDLIQTDASINPGNSGGPLMNRFGEVIGINTVRVQSAESMGFAVPVNICESVIDALEKTGEFETPYLGLYAYTSQTAKYLKKENGTENGLFVISLDKDGPSYKSGIKYGDMITRINNVAVNNMLKLRRELFKYRDGEKIVLSIVSDGRLNDVEVTLGKMKSGYLGTNQ